MEYTVDYFIEKFKNIPEQYWASGVFNKDKAFCAQGHCMGYAGIDAISALKGIKTKPEVAKMFPEWNALIELFRPFNAPDRIGVALINNGDHPDYKQDTPKQRILAALQDIKGKQVKPVLQEIIWSKTYQLN